MVYSRKYFQEDLEDFGRFDDQGASESGKSMAAIELEEWEGRASNFTKIRGVKERRDYPYRETEELYTEQLRPWMTRGEKAVRGFQKQISRHDFEMERGGKLMGRGGIGPRRIGWLYDQKRKAL